LLVTSRSAKLLAVRRVTQDNRGKRTAGVDGVKSLTPPQRLALATTLTLPTMASPTRRVWIPKPGTDEQRPLGIPVMHDRAAQALLTLALEPEWEARFEPHSYGFRPGRSAHDALEAIFTAVCHRAKYVLDADIAKCFDRISHSALLQKLHTTPTFARAIRAWLKAGVLDGATLFPTEAGTPQGGVASPLLANIALHGLEEAVKAPFPTELRVNGERLRGKPHVVRYADDLVILHDAVDVVEQAKAAVTTWLAGMGLELKPSKTRIVHTLHDHAGQPPGFDFLGFTVRNFPVGKTHSAKVNGRTKTPRVRGHKALTSPSKAAVKRHEQHLKQLIRWNSATSQEALLANLNPVVAGWTNYYRTSAARATFVELDYHLFLKLRRWATKRHRNKGRRWVVTRYWHPERGEWRFATPDGTRVLRKHVKTRIQRHIPVQGDRSPYDGDWSYWATRLGRYPLLSTRVARLLKRQRGHCLWCGLLFTLEDHREVDHIVPLAQGGQDRYENLQLLHQHCHDQKTARDLTRTAGVRVTGPRH
jgi:RNA-directed DNA polymerase